MISNTTVRFIVAVPKNHYVAIGYGVTMTNCDMVAWQANGASSTVLDLYSLNHQTPATDSVNNYVTNFTYNSSYTLFVSDRLLDTGDSKDFVIPYVSFPSL